MASPDQVDLSGLSPPLGGELADGFQHPITRLSEIAPNFDHYQRAVGQRRQQLEAGGRADSQRRLEVEPAGEHRELPQERLLRLR